MSDELANIPQVGPLGPLGDFRFGGGQSILTVTGEPGATLFLVPAPYISRTISALKTSSTRRSPKEIRQLMAKAAAVFLEHSIDGLTLAEYETRVSLITGLAISSIRAASQRIANYCIDAQAVIVAGMPRAAVLDPSEAELDQGKGIWTRRGDVLGVQVAGNHPAVHTAWLEALAVGYRIALRPSQREPLTASRLVQALHAGGFGADEVALLTTDHTAAATLLSHCDLSIIYGGDAVVEAHLNDPRTLAQGPGRSKILVRAEALTSSATLATVVDAVSKSGGVGCTNTTSVYVEGSAADFAAALATQLTAIPALRPTEPDAVLPVHPQHSGARLAEHLGAVAADAEAVLGADQMLADLGDGSVALRPTVYLLTSAEDARASVELPFPCVWVAPWQASDGVAPFKRTLALTLIADDEGLVRDALSEPTIRNVYWGNQSTVWSAPCVPHDDYLGGFLMESKGYVRRGIESARDS